MKIENTNITLETNQDLLNPDGTRFIGPMAQYYVPDWSDPLLGPCTVCKTAFGVTMSLGMSQFYSMLAHHKIGISSFSTDQCVLRELPKLRDLEKKLLEAGFSVQRWTMIQDLRNIMRRLPANRSATGNRLIPTKIEAETRAGVEPSTDAPSTDATEATKTEAVRFSLLEID